jgi:hypothetical protein
MADLNVYEFRTLEQIFLCMDSANPFFRLSDLPNNSDQFCANRAIRSFLHILTVVQQCLQPGFVTRRIRNVYFCH